jgi:uncharacterized phage-associated protein
MKSIIRRIKNVEKEMGGTCVIPEKERVVWVKGYTEQERDAKMEVRLAELRQKYGAFDESCLTLIYIREFCLNNGIVEG